MRTWRGSLILLTLPMLMAGERVAPAPAGRAQSEARLRRDITFLASDACEGRGPGTPGINKAADYIVAQFKQAGLKPGGVEGSYFQPFTINANVLDEPARLALRGPQGQTIALKQGVQFWPMALGGSGKNKAAAVFAGYGISSKKADYDDFAEVDVFKKVVILLRGAPRRADKDVIGPFLTNKAGFLKDTVRPLTEKEETVYVIPGSDAEEYAPRRFPKKKVKRAGSGIRATSIAGFLFGLKLLFQPGKAAKLNAAYHFTFTDKEPKEATITIRDGTLQVRDGHQGEADLRVAADSETWLGFLAKERNLLWALHWAQFRLEPPNAPVPMQGKLLLRNLLGSAGLEMSLNAAPPGQGMPFLHKRVSHAGRRQPFLGHGNSR